MLPRRAAPPCWFVLLVTVVGALACRSLDGVLTGGVPGDGHEPPIQMAFWGFLVAIASAIWKGVEVAGRVTLAALSWSVKALWWFATTTANGLKAVGSALLVAAKKTWQFFELTYDRVLRPALEKLWRWFQKFHKWLEDTFGPVLRFIQAVKEHVTKFYTDWIRPWLDVIDVTRRMLRVFGQLGLTWARELDKRLGAIQEQIERPFRLVIGKLNEVIGIVNRVITLDGLVQRAALLRSLGRDMRYAWRMAIHWRHQEMTEAEYVKLRSRLDPRSEADVLRDYGAAVLDGGGPYHAVISEQLVVLQKRLGGP